MMGRKRMANEKKNFTRKCEDKWRRTWEKLVEKEVTSLIPMEIGKKIAVMEWIPSVTGRTPDW